MFMSIKIKVQCRKNKIKIKVSKLAKYTKHMVIVWIHVRLFFILLFLQLVGVICQVECLE